MIQSPNIPTVPPEPSEENADGTPQVEQVRVNDLRLSIIWNETIPDLLAGEVANDRLSFLRQSYTYEPQFAALQQGQQAAQQNDWELPWHHPGKHHYWNNYLERGAGKTLLSVTPAQAWHALVPLRKKLYISAAWLTNGRLVLEAFFYPHGLALVLTAMCRGDFTLNQTVELAFRIRRARDLTIQWSQNEQETVSADALASVIFARLRRDYLGATAAEGISSEPFTVFTVVRATGVDYNTPVENRGAIHRILEALARWSPSWQLNQLPDLTQVSLGMRESPSSHILYSHRRGRVVWYPSAFTPESGVVSSLSCYHRNLVFASMQTESLCGLVTKVADRMRTGFRLPTGEQLSVSQRACARNAADMIGVIYGAKKHKTYRSYSPRI